MGVSEARGIKVTERRTRAGCVYLRTTRIRRSSPQVLALQREVYAVGGEIKAQPAGLRVKHDDHALIVLQIGD